MTCEQVNDELSAYLDGELPADARTAVESHLAGCVECKQAAEELKSIAAAIHDLPRLKAPASLVATVHDRVQTSPAPLLLIDSAPSFTASSEVVKPRSTWAPVAFGIAAVLMLFALAFVVMPTLSENGNTTAMLSEERRKANESDRSAKAVEVAEDRGEGTSAKTPAETATTAAPVAENAKTAGPVAANEKRADYKAAPFGPKPENKPNTVAEGLAVDGKPEMLNKATEERARKSTTEAERIKREEPLAAAAPAPAVTPTPAPAPAPARIGANANGVPAERRALELQQEKQADGKTRAADAVPMDDITIEKKQAEFGARSGGARRSAAKDQAPAALPPAPGNAAPAAVVVPATPPPAPKPSAAAPAAPAPVAAESQKADALPKAAQHGLTGGQDKAPTAAAASDVKQKSAAAPAETGKELAAEKNQLKEAGELRRDADPATRQQQEQTQGGKGAARGGAQPTDGALAGKREAADAPRPLAKRARPGESALEDDEAPRKDGGNLEQLKSLKDDADRRNAGTGGEGGGAAGQTRNNITLAMAFRTRDPQSLRAQMANLALQHGGTLVSKGPGTQDLVAHIPPAQRDAFVNKLAQLQARSMDEAAKAAAVPEAKKESRPFAESTETLTKEKKDEKAVSAEVVFNVVIETLRPPATDATNEAKD